ncbi:NAD(P)-dependent oxidoreductase [Leptolyngbya sp. AN02str]|uniref:NAD(P)-dependent oxidoreductase n=1 Tax=Leptolyngbya sp. AN02str TaxID=3423363 RepID=UPI003D31FEA2
MKIGLIGTGLMGLPMAERLLAANIPLVLYNRTVEKLQPLQAVGAELADSVEELLLRCQVVILMLSDAPTIHEVVVSETAQRHLCDRTIIQMGTIAPSESRTLAAAIAQAGGDFLEAPVLGSIPEVKSGTRQIMVGSTPDQYEQWAPLLKHLGQPMHIGAVGSAAGLKLALNQLIASLTTAFATSLHFVQQQEVPTEQFMQVLRQSALYAPTFDKKLARMVEQNFANPNFPTKHLLKDTRLFLREAHDLGLHTESLEGVQHLLELACAQGLAEEDYSALSAAIPAQEDQKN